jgi:hypothetical protein
MLDTNERQAVTYFVGYEVEHTVCHGMKTLFVVGTPPYEEIKKVLSNENCTDIKHIYFGTSQSFNPPEQTMECYEPWDLLINSFLNDGYWVTLDFDVKHVNGILESGYCEYNRFVPMISVKMPYISLFNYNATVKIDDITWGKTNPGVWTHPLNKLLDRNCYTHWDQYTQDTTINLTDCQ